MLNQSSYTIINADIILSGTDGRVRLVDIKNSIVEIVFFESINKSYVDARIVMLDDFGFRNDLSIQGTERINLVIGHSDDPNSAVINKTFFFSKINDIEKTNERAEVLSLDLVEEHVYVNAIKSISRSYTKTLEDMIIDIADRDLGRRVIKTAYFDKSAQNVRKVIIPYLSPLEAMTWLKDRMTTKTGSPIYVHGDLYSNDIFMSGLDGLLQENVVNEKLPLRYNTASSSGDEEQEAQKVYYQIKQFEELDAEDSLALYEEGAIGSMYANIDAGTGQTFESHITVRTILDDFYTNGLISQTTRQSIFDPSLIIDGKPSDEYNSLNIHQVTSSNTYNQFKSYHDEEPQFFDDAITESRLKIRNKVIRQILKKNTIDIEMDGRLFFKKKISPSRRMRIIFLNPNTAGDNAELDKSVDTRKSGDYLLTNISHRLSNESHRVSARLIKLGDLPSDFSL
jgi:hypothetical protein